MKNNTVVCFSLFWLCLFVCLLLLLLLVVVVVVVVVVVAVVFCIGYSSKARSTVHSP